MGTIEKAILAVVTRDMERVAGGAPIFYAETEGRWNIWLSRWRKSSTAWLIDWIR